MVIELKFVFNKVLKLTIIRKIDKLSFGPFPISKSNFFVKRSIQPTHKDLFICSRADLGSGCRGCAPPPPPPEITFRLLISLVFCSICLRNPSVTSFLSGTPSPRNNPGSAPGHFIKNTHQKLQWIKC